MLTNTTLSKNAKVHPVDGRSVTWTDGLWAERVYTCAHSTVPQLQHMFEEKDISHVVENFRICAGEADGDFDGTVFGDGDFYKWMEAAVYTAVKTKDEALLSRIDDYISLIGRAQQPDGYLSTKQIIGERSGNGVSRMGDINDFEVYNFGHMFTSACLHYRMTGKDSFLRIASRTCDYLEKLYETAEKTGDVQTAVCPSHYMGLAELYRTTREERYLSLLKKAIRLRDSVKNGLDDNQDRIPLKEHDRIIGHAVRANYLYAGLADLCLEDDSDDQRDYMEVLHKVWNSLISKKLYITGGCGALYNGVSPYGNFFMDQKIHQAYGYEYQLPNITAYNETCASIGGVFWAFRMFQLEPKAVCFDVLERMMLNTNLAALSMDGKRFFYENTLRREKELDYKLVWPLTRSEYILSYCCPPNLARTISQSEEYAYMADDSSVWTGMYGSSRAKIRLSDGACFTLVQQTDYPYDGRIVFTAEDVERTGPFTLRLRLPGWMHSGSIEIMTASSCSSHAFSAKDAESYFAVTVEDPEDMKIILTLDMPVRYTRAHNMVEETVGQACIERGPLVYCCEGMDADLESLDDLYLDPEAVFSPVWTEIEGRRVLALDSMQYGEDRSRYDRTSLYQTLCICGISGADQVSAQTDEGVPGFYKTKVRMIPYFAWDNREFEQMRIWFPVIRCTERND